MTRESRENGRFKVGHEKCGGFEKGSRHSDESKRLISESLKGQHGSTARRWKGEEASYAAKHMWIVKHYGKAACCENPDCTYDNPKRYEWANISGEYRRDREDYKQLCPSCHRKMDIAARKGGRNNEAD